MKITVRPVYEGSKKKEIQIIANSGEHISLMTIHVDKDSGKEIAKQLRRAAEDLEEQP